jgi:hypothetical protein
MFKIRGFQARLAKYSAPIIIFVLLVAISGASFYVAYWQTNAINQSFAINLATESLFALFTIFGITSIESYRRRRENKNANEPVYADLKLELKKTMLKLLVALGRADGKSLIRTNFDYSIDEEIYEAFYELVDDPDNMDPSIVVLYPRRDKDINTMVEIKRIISEGIRMVEAKSNAIKPGPNNTHLIQQYSLWEIEDIDAYKKYLRSGARYGSYYIYEKGRFTGVKTEVHTEEWEDTLRRFKSDLIRDMKYLADIYDSAVFRCFSFHFLNISV